MPHVLGGPPPPANFLALPQTLSFWGNNLDGDCVTAEEAFAKACHSSQILIADDTALNWASLNNFLNGAVISEALEIMTTRGFLQDGRTYGDGVANTVDWTNRALLNSAIAQGPVKLGVAADQLDSVVTSGTNGWFATGFKPDDKEDHCVSLSGYGTLDWLAGQMGVQTPAGVDGTQPGYAMFCWNSVGIIDAPSMVAITQEAWVRSPTTTIT
jgi:hypothetical protein